ncbi:dynein axonemal heavy chain 12-like [Venturia canescens]|uniref:dynein axonemal heavy chain 12-like n=1 Tax=Venturia canescens TaxID=32260 RepID=UPI001C9C25FD|nr:dynein axonemal heavy chain 12-like [Venturia canescens]
MENASKKISLRCPRLELRLVWKPEDSRLSIEPPIFQIYSMWHSLIRGVENIADDLPGFEEESMFPGGRTEPMRIALPDWYSSEGHRKVDEALAKAVNPLKKYFVKMADDFEAVTSAETRKKIETLILPMGQAGTAQNVDMNIDYRSSVKVLNEQNEQASGITEILDSFDIGRLDQRPARIQLIDEVADTRKILIEGMLQRHEEYNEKICQDFENLRDKLLDIPDTAHELFKLSELIAYPSMSLLLEGFEARVSKSVEMLNSLLALTSDMSEKHVRINGATINWLVDIKPIVTKSNTLCEAMKSELEDELQRRIARLNLEIEAILPKFEVLDYMDDPTRVDDYADHIGELLGHLNQLDQEIQKINYEEKLFKFPETSFTSVEEIREILLPVKTLNSLVKEWNRDHAVWMDGPFEYINAAEVRRKTIHHYRETFERLNGSLRVKIKNDLQQSSSSAGPSTAKRLKLYTGIVDDPDPMQQPAPLTMCTQVLEQVKQFESHLELIDCVCNPSLRQRHWHEISLIYQQSRRMSKANSDRSASLASSSLIVDTPLESAGEPSISAPDAGTTLSKLIRLDLAKDIEKYRVISIGANKELALADRLNRMIARWDTVDFSIGQSPVAIKTFLRIDEIESLMEEHETVIGEMRVSYFVKPIIQELADFSCALNNVNCVVKSWLRIQKDWQEFEKVFVKKAKNKDLARAHDRFFSVRHDVIQVVEKTILKEPKFRAIGAESSKLSKLLAEGEDTLEGVRGMVQSFIGDVRKLFPRFYFISEREAIDILFETNFQKKMSLLVRRCFTNMNATKCNPVPPLKNRDDSKDRNSCRVTSIIDSSSQEFTLIDPFNEKSSEKLVPGVNGSFVSPFITLEETLRHTIRHTITKSFYSLLELDEVASNDLEQILSILTDGPVELAGLCSLRLLWSTRMEEALNHGEVVPAMDGLTSYELEQSKMIELMLARLKDNTIPRTRRRKLVLFIVEILKQRDITKLMMSKVVKSGGRFARDNFAWRAQIRYYWRDPDVAVSLLASEESYGYEYSSCIEKDSVICTPLTERCYHSLMEAHRNRLYGLVYGPGATGKTRTIEALARVLGVVFRTFDCAQGHLNSYHCMDSVFHGLAGCSPSSSSSCWLLFKNLDDIRLQGLSVLAERITSIKSMIEKRCFVTGTISTRAGAPKGRSALPDAVKVLFRPVAFAFPDTKRIVEISLFAEGFSTAATLAEKLGLFVKYLSETTCSFTVIRDCWDSGIRTTRTLVKTACALKTRYPNESEDTLLLRALIDVHLPKLIRPHDLATFQHIADDLFPNVVLPPPNYGNLMKAIRRELDENGPLNGEHDPYLTLILKIIQLFELLLTGQVILVVGSSLAGKTTMIETLARSLSSMDHEDEPRLSVDSTRINHQSYSGEELFGSCGRRSQSSGGLCWKDGILSRALRGTTTARNPDGGKTRRWQWLVLDGPLHTSLIDKMTTLLDTNDRTLVVGSGEKIPMGDSTSIVFETSSTIEATPATISRCGIIHIEESSTIHWKTRIKQWIFKHQTSPRGLIPSPSSSEHRDGKTSVNEGYDNFLQSLLEWSLDKCLGFIQKNLISRQGGLPIDENHSIASVLRLLEIYLTGALEQSEDHPGKGLLSKDSSGVSSRDRRNPHEEDRKQDHVKNSENERVKLYTTNFFSWSQAAVLMSIVWGLGGSLHREARVAFDEFCRSMWRTNADFPYDVISAPSEGLIEDNIYVFSAGASGSGCWRHSLERIKKTNVAGDEIDHFWSSKPNATSYVSTVDSVRYMSLFESHVKSGQPFLVTGETASGKTLYLRHLLKTKMAPKGYQTNFYNFGADSSSFVDSNQMVQNLIISRMKKVDKRVYEPNNRAKFCVNFIDDWSVVPGSKGDATLRELIRQYYESSHPDGCWYDVNTGDRILLNNLIFLGAIDQSATRKHSNLCGLGDGRWLEAGRFFRHFNLYLIDPPSAKSIFRIGHNILLSNLRSNMFNADVSGTVTSIINATIEVYSSIVQRLRPVPSKLQYRFSLRDVSRLIDGCCLIHKESAETKVTLMRLWVHEMIRVFADRVVDQSDAEWFFDRMKESAKSHFKDTWDTVFDSLPKHAVPGGPDQLTKDSFRHLVFSDFMRLPDTPRDSEVIRNNARASISSGENTAAKQQQQQHRYEEINSFRDGLKNRALFYLERYNDQVNVERKLDLLLFPEMLEHLIRICRILDIPGGSLLMICFGGSSGRRSLTALAAHIKSQRLEELSCGVIESMMSSNTPLAAWRDDFKRACFNCIGESSKDFCNDLGATNTRIKDCTFFISDREIIGSNSCSSILSDICSLMKTGQTTDTNFFTTEERDSIVEKCRLLAQKGDRNREMSSLEVLDYFYHTCQEKLHFVLYFDKSGLRSQGPLGEGTLAKILNHCTIDCCGNWPEEALYEIGNKFMKSVDIENRVKSATITVSKYFWDDVIIGKENAEGIKSDRSSAVVASRGLPVAAYIHMVKLYGLSINKRQNEIRVSREKYLSGLDKLKSADEEVRKMRSTLTRLRPELESSAKETTETMQKIETENVSVEMATIQVKREEEAANEIAEVASILKEECEADLAVAIPILEDAIAALNTLKPTDITLVKAMKNPPDTVKLVLAAVCVMLGVPPDRSTDPVTGKKSIDYWAPSKRILGDMNFLQNLKDYDKDNIPPSVMTVVNKSYMNDESFMPHIVAKASSAAEGLCKWVRAMVSYDEVAKVVAPKKEKLAAAERECNAILEYLNEKRTSLAALNEKLAALNASLQATLAKKLQLENEVASCTDKLKRAEALIASLAGEKARWLEAAETLTRTCDNLAGDVLLSCGLVALLSSFSVNQRDNYIMKWRKELDLLKIPNSGESYDFLASLRSNVNPRPVGSGPSEDPKHRLSLNSSFNQANTLILEHSLLWPLIFDPQNQANIWIKRVESSNGLVVVKPTNPLWFVQIRECIERNLPVLLENVDRSVYLEKTPAILRYSSAFSTSPHFRLYMTSRISFNEASGSRRLDEPHDMYKRFSVVNFALANETLEDRLLEIIVSREKPELRNTFDRLMMTSAANRRLLDQEENQILEILSGASVNIIEDERAIEKLDRWKQLSHEMKVRQIETVKATEREMDELRSTYRPLTKYCAALYDTLAYLVNFNHMYRFSLDWFVRLYVRSIDTSMRSVILHKRLRYLGSSFTLTLDASVRNALLDEHKLLYSFLLSIKILLDSKKMDRMELGALFLTNVVDCKCEEDYNLGQESGVETPSSEIRDIKFTVGQQLSNALPKIFHDLPKSFQEESSLWDGFCNGDIEGLPAPWDSELTDFQRLILVNRLRPEKTLEEVYRLVENTLGWNSFSTSSTRIRDNIVARSYDESSCVVPLIFVLPSYLVPHGLVQKWARTIGFSSKVQRILMPPSSPVEYSGIEAKIEAARKHGGWVLLENCHLASDEWLARLESISESLGNNDDTALSFRLWLTSYPSTNFPISILHDGTKIYCEQPGDQIKQSLLDFYASEPLDDPDFYNTLSAGNNARTFSKLVYALCFFHAIVTGRQRFHNLAWNVGSYEFTDSDLKISIGYLHRGFQIDQSRTSTGNGGLKRDSNGVAEDLVENLMYLVGECYYGGRILDPVDRDCLKVILNSCCNIELVRSVNNYVFEGADHSSTNVYEYSAPNRTEYRDFVRHIKDSLPIGEAPPGIFGLDNNAAILRDHQNSDYFVHSLTRSLLLIDNDISAHPDEPVRPRLLDVVRDIRTKLKLKSINDCSDAWLDLERVTSHYPVAYKEPLNAVLVEEVQFHNRLIAVIEATLTDVETKIFEAEYEIIESLSQNRVPGKWMICGLYMTNSIDCSTLSRFIEALSSRHDFFSSWIENGHYKGSLWVGGLADCRKFLLAAQLTLSRKIGIPPSSLAVMYEVTNVRTDQHKLWKLIAVAADLMNCTHIHGLHLSGARWDVERSTLVETLPKVYWNPMPIIRLIPSSIDSLSTRKEEQWKTNYYACPLNRSPVACQSSSFHFLGSLSVNYITRIPLESKDIKIEHWIKRRTLLYCNK